MKYPTILQVITFCLIGLWAASPLAAQQREWAASDGSASFKAELVNAYGDTAYFMKEDGAYIHMPIVLLSRPDVARILVWARERDAKPSSIFYNCQGQVVRDLCKQWPNVVEGEALKEADINQITTPSLFLFLMVKKETTNLDSMVRSIIEAKKSIDGEDGHFLQLVALTPLKGNDIKPIVYSLGKKGVTWLMPNEWAYKEKSSIWNSYWRWPDVNILILDPEGNVLCDGSAKEPNGSMADPVAFLGKIAKIADNLRKGGESVPNPYLNEEAISQVLAKELVAKTTIASPQPVMFDFSGIDDEMFKTMEGNNYLVSIDIGTDGKARNLILKKGGDAAVEAALRQASTLWQFIPVLKDGIPQEKTVGIPIRIKGPAPAKTEGK
jgi:hypothetical protein